MCKIYHPSHPGYRFGKEITRVFRIVINQSTPAPIFGIIHPRLMRFFRYRIHTIYFWACPLRGYTSMQSSVPLLRGQAFRSTHLPNVRWVLAAILHALRGPQQREVRIRVSFYATQNFDPSILFVPFHRRPILQEHRLSKSLLQTLSRFCP